jgi:hypothetical protein
LGSSKSNAIVEPYSSMYSKPIEAQYNGFRISGAAQPVAMSNKRWFAVGEVSLNKREHSVLLVDRFLDDNLIYDDEVLSKWFGLGIAEIMVDHCLPPAEYFFLPMNVDWADDIFGAPLWSARNGNPAVKTI